MKQQNYTLTLIIFKIILLVFKITLILFGFNVNFLDILTGLYLETMCNLVSKLDRRFHFAMVYQSMAVSEYTSVFPGFLPFSTDQLG